MPKRCLAAAVAALTLAATMAAANLPRPSRDFAIRLNDGKQVRVSQYKGQVCVVAFILTTCPHCQKTVGYLSEMQKEYGPRGLQVVASAIEDNASLHVPDFIKRFQPAFPVGFNSRDPVMNFLQHPTMVRMLMPQLVFIDREGVIRAQYAGDHKFFMDGEERNLRAQIEALLKAEPAVSKKGAGNAPSRMRKNSENSSETCDARNVLSV